MPRDFTSPKLDTFEEVIAKMKGVVSAYEEFKGKMNTVLQEISEFVGPSMMEEVSPGEFRNRGWLQRATLVHQWMRSEK